MNEVLAKYIETVPVIKDALGIDMMMSITDGEQFLAYWRGKKMVADIKVGDKLSHDDPMWTSFTTGQKIEQICPATVYGFAFKAITLAIRDGSQIVGTMGIAVSLEDQSLNTDASRNLLSSVDTVKRQMDSIIGYGTTIKESSDVISSSADRIMNNISEVQSFAQAIQKISNSTNMLSLNASIEAARSGEAGKGFAVVAKEMTKLAMNTKESSEKILSILNRFVKDIDEMKESLETQEDSQNKQTDISNQLYAEIQKISDITRRVMDRSSL